MASVPEPREQAAPIHCASTSERPQTIGALALHPVSAAVLLCAALVLLSYLLAPRGTVENDVSYYFAWAQWASMYGFADAMREYPTPVALMLWLPSLLVSTDAGYMTIFVGLSIVLALLGAWLITRLPTGGTRAAVTYLLALGALGIISFYRFDLLPGLLLAGACVAHARGHRGWTAFLALGTAIKLWPIITWPLALGRASTRRRELISALIWSAAIIALSVWAAGWERLISPLTWQSDRGLQVESLLATWVLLARLVSPGSWEANLSSANSWDFTGPGVGATIAVASFLEVAFGVWILVLIARMWRSRDADPLAVTLSAASMVALLLATNKVFSPQYMMWLAPVVAVAIGLGGSRVPPWWGPILILTCAMTQFSYPVTYAWLYPGSADWHFLAGTLLMVTRNGLVILLASSLSVAAWRSLTIDEVGPALVDPDFAVAGTELQPTHLEEHS